MDVTAARWIQFARSQGLMGAAGITSRCLSTSSRPRHLCRPHASSAACRIITRLLHSVVAATIAKDDGSARRLHPLIPALRHCRLRRVQIDLNSPACPKTFSRERRDSTPPPPTLDVNLPVARTALFTDDTAAARLHELTDWSSRNPISSLPPIRRPYRLPLRQRRQCLPGAPEGQVTQTPTDPSPALSTAIERRLDVLTAASVAAATSAPTTSLGM